MTQGTESARVEQVDREAALKCLLNLRDYSDDFRDEMLRGLRDASMTIQAFARHRIAAIESGFRAGMIKAREGLEETFAACGVDWEPRHD